MNAKPNPFIATLVLAALLCGCVSSISSRPATGGKKDRGYSYHLPQPFLKVAVDAEGKLTKEVVLIPDPTREYVVDARSIMASHIFKPRVSKAGFMTSVDYTLDSTAVMNTLITALGSLAKTTVTDGEKQQKLDDTQRKTDFDEAKAKEEARAKADLDLKKAEWTAYQTEIASKKGDLTTAESKELELGRTWKTKEIAYERDKEDYEVLKSQFDNFPATGKPEDRVKLEADVKKAKRKMEDSQAAALLAQEDYLASKAKTVAAANALNKAYANKPDAMDAGRLGAADEGAGGKDWIARKKTPGPAFFRIDDLGDDGVRLVPVTFKELPGKLKMHTLNGGELQRYFDTWHRKAGDTVEPAQKPPTEAWTIVGGDVQVLKPGGTKLTVDCNVDVLEIAPTGVLKARTTGAVVPDAVIGVSLTTKRQATIQLKADLAEGEYSVQIEPKYVNGNSGKPFLPFSLKKLTP